MSCIRPGRRPEARMAPRDSGIYSRFPGFSHVEQSLRLPTEGVKEARQTVPNLPYSHHRPGVKAPRLGAQRGKAGVGCGDGEGSARVPVPGSCGGGTGNAREVAATARRAESLGFSGLVLPDHLIRQHAPIPVLATVAAVTERLRIGTFVFNVNLRHPAVLAQDLASLDVLSGGRLEIGIGAGWNRPEHDAIGLPF